MRESSIQQRIMFALGAGLTRIFRVNTGQAWAGSGPAYTARKAGPVMCQPGDVVLRAGRPLEMGLTKGGSDLIGWSVVTVSADMIGRDVAVFTAIEVKAEGGRIRPEQVNFIDQVRKAGGIAGVARSEEEARALIDTYRSSAGC